MQSVSTLPTPVLEAIACGATILTPGQRAARTLRLAYDNHQHQSGGLTWTPPEIHPLDAWLAHLWHRLTLTGQAQQLLLNPTQEHTLWRQIITQDPEVSGLRSPDSLAELAAQTYRTLCLHNGRTRLPNSATSTDTRAFERWALAFQRLCTRHAYLPAAQLPEALTALKLPLLPSLLLVDFDHLTPAHQTLLANIPHTRHQTSTPVATQHLHPAQDAQSELRAAAQWAADTLATNPQARIAIVVPDLTPLRSQLTRIFAHLPHEIALGTPLADTALTTTALNLLSFSLSPQPLETISNLLLSPYLIFPAEQLPAAEFDAFTLRRHTLLRPELSLESLIDLLAKSPRLPSLLTHLRALHHAAKSPNILTAQQTHADWADTFRALLEASGWSRLATQDSLSFQTHRRFSSALDELSTLDFDGSRPTAPTALATLTRILRQTVFAPESQQAPIQILGPLEIGAIPIDALWFLSAGDLSWPIPPSPTPLLSWQLQQSLQLPGSNPTRDRAAALTLTTRIATSATHVVFSYATHLDDAHQRPSPTLTTLDLTLTPPQSPPDPTPIQPYQLIEDQITLPPLPDTVIRGGAAILQLQAACAFRAFAEKRLFSSEPEPSPLGLDPGARGEIVHKVMEEFWSRVHDQHELKALTLAARDAILTECITLALRKTDRLAQSPWDEAYLALQHQRLLTLLRPWLDIESQRPPFAVRTQESEDRHAQLGPLTLSLRTDRVDETEAGPVILDYKTGLASPNDWLSDRPDAPQLPLYAILSPEPVAGVAFALLRAGDDLAIKGYADSDSVFGKPTRRKDDLTLADQVEDWHRILTNLATAFADGDTSILPKSYPQTCTYCAQRILCRLNPANLNNEEEQEEVFNG